MVLKRKLPSRSNPDAPKNAGDVNTSPDLSTTDFSAKPTKNTQADQNVSTKDNTDSFTADALKEAAAAMKQELSNDAPKNDLYLDDPFSDLPTSNTPAPANDNTPMPDVFADLDEIPAPTPKAEIKVEPEPEPTPEPEPEVTAAPAPKPESKTTPATEIDLSSGAKMKRNKRNKRKRAAMATTEAPQPERSAEKTDNSAATNTFTKASTEPTPTEPNASTADMELAAHNKRDEKDAKAEVDRAFKEMSGDIPDPAEQEIEAAYLNPAEVNPEFLANAPKPDVAALVAAEIAPDKPAPEEIAVEAPLIEKPEPQKTPTPIAEDPASFELPQSFSSFSTNTQEDAPATIKTPEPKTTAAPAPKIDPESKPEVTASKEVEETPQEIKPKAEEKPAPTPSLSSDFNSPASFAEIAETDKKIAPLPWEQEATAAEDAQSAENSWQIDTATPLPPAPDIYAPTDENTIASAVQIAAENGDTPAQSSATVKTAPNTSEMPNSAPDLAQIDPKTDTSDTNKPKLGNLPLAFLQNKNNPEDSKSTPPELPGGTGKSTAITPKKPFNFKAVGMLAAAAIILFVGAKLIGSKDETQERVARFTGALDNAPKTVTDNQKPSLQPERVVTSSELDKLNKELEEDLALLSPPTTQNPTPNSQIAFVDVTKEEANQPIMADKDAPLPGEQGFVASLQNAIKNERQKQGQPTDKPTQNKTVAATPEDRLEESKDLQQQVEDELAAYRQALAQSNPNLPVKPNDFFASVNENGVLLPPKAKSPAGARGLPASEVYTENPYNLPVIAEPETDPIQTVRTLDSFDVAMFEPPKNKVRIPRGLKPRLRASDFPEITVLSLVPNKGMIAHTNGREGVLLIGEALEGWELFAVTAQHAEFRSGQRKFYVNADQ